MGRRGFYILCALSLSAASAPIRAYPQEEAETKYDTKYGMTWYLDKTDVFDSARVQGKLIFALWGSQSCSICNGTKERLAGDVLKPIVDAHYLLWHIDYIKDDEHCYIGNYCSDDAPAACDAIAGYFDSLCGNSEFTYLPAICIIDPSDTIPIAHSLRHGKNSDASLEEMLRSNVSNEPVESVEIAGKAYIHGDGLVLESPFYNEEVSVFSIAGALIDKFRKTDVVFSRNVSGYPAGLLIVSGSSGWKQKILKK